MQHAPGTARKCVQFTWENETMLCAWRLRLLSVLTKIWSSDSKWQGKWDKRRRQPHWSDWFTHYALFTRRFFRQSKRALYFSNIVAIAKVAKVAAVAIPFSLARLARLARLAIATKIDSWAMPIPQAELDSCESFIFAEMAAILVKGYFTFLM